METRDRLLTPGEVAALFRVDPKTVTRWAIAGRIASIRTPGGHRRFRESDVRARLRGDAPQSNGNGQHAPTSAQNGNGQHGTAQNGNGQQPAPQPMRVPVVRVS